MFSFLGFVYHSGKCDRRQILIGLFFENLVRNESLGFVYFESSAELSDGIEKIGMFVV